MNDPFPQLCYVILRKLYVYAMLYDILVCYVLSHHVMFMLCYAVTLRYVTLCNSSRRHNYARFNEKNASSVADLEG